MEEFYRTVVEHSNDGIVIVRGDARLFCNATFARMFGYESPEDLLDKPLYFSIHPDDKAMVQDYSRRRQEGLPVPSRYEARFFRKDGSLIHVELSSVKILYRGEPASLGITRDITERKRMEEELLRQRDTLEVTVGERTAELAAKSQALEEMNGALKVLLRQRDEDLKEAEGRFLANVTKLVLPYVERVRQGPLDPEQASSLAVVEANLREITSPLLHGLRHFNLTPKETQVASLIKTGKTTKEIARIMGVAASAVHSHRKNIRRKLALPGTKRNLQAYIATLS